MDFYLPFGATIHAFKPFALAMRSKKFLLHFYPMKSRLSHNRLIAGAGTTITRVGNSRLCSIPQLLLTAPNRKHTSFSICSCFALGEE